MEPKIDLDIKEEDLKESDFTPEELEAEDVDWKAKAQEVKGIAKRRATQLSKAKEKLGESGKRISDLEAELAPFKQKPPEKKDDLNKPNEPDYAKLGFLNSIDIKHPDDQKLVMDEAARLKLPISDISQMEHIKLKLQANKDQREAEAGLPGGQGRSGGKGKDVDYYINNPDKIPPTQDIAEKVLDAKMKQEQGDTFGPFSHAG